MELSGDYTGNGAVDTEDLNLVLFNWNVVESELNIGLGQPTTGAGDQRWNPPIE